MKFLKSLAVMVAIAATSPVTARTILNDITVSGIDSGGAKAVVCFDADEKPIAVQLYDIFEGEALFQLTYSSDDRHYLEVLESMLTRHMENEIDAAESYASTAYAIHDQRMQLLPEDAALPDLDDTGPIVLPRGNCKIKQLAIYLPEHVLLVDSVYWGLLSAHHKAALLLHEAVWLHLRNAGWSATSERARRIVAHLASDTWAATGPRVNLSEKSFYCTSELDQQEAYNLYIDTVDEDSYRLQFVAIAGDWMISETYVDVPSSLFPILPKESVTSRFPDLGRIFSQQWFSTALKSRFEKARSIGIKTWFERVPDTEGDDSMVDYRLRAEVIDYLRSDERDRSTPTLIECFDR